MARLRNINSGAIVSVADEKVARLGAEWEPVSDSAPPKPAPAPAPKPATKPAKK